MTTPTPMPTPVPTTQLPCEPTDVEAVVPGVWAAGASLSAIMWALGQVEDYCGRTFAKATGDVVRIDPGSLLPNPPVLAITRVEALMRPLGSLAAPAWSDLTSYGWTDDGEVYDTSVVRWASWPTLPRSLRVTYDHGFINWPPPVIGAVKALAAAFLVNPTGMTEQRTAETMNKWYTGGATAGGHTLSGQVSGGVTSGNALDRYVLVEVG